MKRSRQILCCRLVVAALTFPLLQTSCVEVAQRSMINGFFDATTPLADEQLAGCLTEALEPCEEP
jgi:hypothetical protein